MVLWQHIVLCKGTSLRMRLTIGVRSVLRCERLAIASLSLRNTFYPLCSKAKTQIVSSVKVKNSRNHASKSPYTFIAWHIANYNLTSTLRTKFHPPLAGCRNSSTTPTPQPQIYFSLQST